MNTPVETSPVTIELNSGPVQSSADNPANGSALAPVSGHRRTGKVALLPKLLREQINLMLEDGLTYRAIIAQLQAPGAPPLPHPITEHNLSEWKDGGYQDWLKNQFWQQELRTRHDAFSGLLAGEDPIRLPEGGLQLAAVGLCELLRDLSPSTAAGEEDPDKYVRAANSLARLSRSILSLQQYRDACARARAALQQMLDPKRKLNQSETRAIVRHVDQILGLSDEDDADQTPQPATPKTTSSDDRAVLSPTREIVSQTSSLPA